MPWIRPSILLGALLLSGCGMTAAQQRMESIRSGVNQANMAQNICIDAVRADPGLASFASLYPEYETLATQSQLDNPGRVTDELRPIFAEAYRRVSLCRQAFGQAMNTVYPEAAMVVATDAATSDRNWSAMISGEISMGEAIRRAAAGQRAYAAQMAFVDNQVYGDLQNRHATELHNRAVAAAALSAAAAGMAAAAQAQQAAIQRQQFINSINRPVTTTCNRFGSTINCTSY